MPGVIAALSLTACPFTDPYFVAYGDSGPGAGFDGSPGAWDHSGGGQGDAIGNGDGDVSNVDSGAGALAADGGGNGAGAGGNGAGGRSAGGGGSSAESGGNSAAGRNGGGADAATDGAVTTSAGACGSGGTGSSSYWLSDGGGNLVGNSTFEFGSLGWAVLGATGATGPTLSAAPVGHCGSKSLLIVGRDLAYQGPSYTLTSKVTEGSSYRVRLWVKLPEPSDGGIATSDSFHVTVSTKCGDADTQFSRWAADATVESKSWKELSGTGTISTCSTYPFSIILYVEGPIAVPSFYIDDVYLEAI